LPALLGCIERTAGNPPARVVDLGCGNGYVAGKLAERGYAMKGVDASEDGIEHAKAKHPHIPFIVGSLFEKATSAGLGTDFDLAISLEVIEHLVYPRELFLRAREVLKRDGWLIISTPYHGYAKNLALSVAGAWDKHHTAGWDGGHIKFFSKKTLVAMAQECGFESVEVVGVGRVTWLWKSMILVCRSR